MVEVIVDSKIIGEELDIGRFSIGQGGLSVEPVIDKHFYELRNLNLKIIRLFLQEYFHPYPKHGVYNWKAMDKCVEAILDVGAKPLMCICFKPKVLFPKINHDIVHPNSYNEWERLIYEMVRHYNVEKKYNIEYWEVANEPDLGEGGGCPYHFTPENYPIYYEHTVRAIKKADRTAKVGGPALANYKSPILPAFLKYCSKNKVPLDFVSWHMYNDDPKNFKESIIYVKKLLNQNKLKAETTIDEWNVSFGSSLMKGLKHPEYQPAFVIDVVNNMIEQGLTFCCYYHIRNINITPEIFKDFISHRGIVGIVDGANYHFNLLGLFDFQGIIRPVYFAFKLLSRMLGRKIYAKASETVKVLASYNAYQDEVNVLIWNFAIKMPKKQKINISIDVKKGDYHYKRYVLDAKCESNNEDARLKVVKWEDLKETSKIKESFELEPYGVTMINAEFKRKNTIVIQ